MHLSPQAMGAIMMALQESLLNELDIVPILSGFKLTETDEGLVVSNPPTVRVTDGTPVADEELSKMVER